MRVSGSYANGIAIKGSDVDITIGETFADIQARVPAQKTRGVRFRGGHMYFVESKEGNGVYQSRQGTYSDFQKDMKVEKKPKAIANRKKL